MQREILIYKPIEFPENLFIRQIWSVKDLEPTLLQEKILPKGTAEIIFNLNDGVQINQPDNGEKTNLPVCFVNGLNTAPNHLAITGKQHFLGVQIHLFALRYLFKLPVAEFNNQILASDIICKSLSSLAEELISVFNFNSQVAAIIKWFRKQLNNSADHLPNQRILQLNSDPALISTNIPFIAEKYNLSNRHLSRVCQEYFGLATEETILYRKYLAALEQVHHTTTSLTEITYACGFYDQPHFARTFKQFTGLSPRQYRKLKTGTPGHLFQFAAE